MGLPVSDALASWPLVMLKRSSCLIFLFDIGVNTEEQMTFGFMVTHSLILPVEDLPPWPKHNWCPCHVAGTLGAALQSRESGFDSCNHGFLAVSCPCAMLDFLRSKERRNSTGWAARSSALCLPKPTNTGNGLLVDFLPFLCFSCLCFLPLSKMLLSCLISVPMLLSAHCLP